MTQTNQTWCFYSGANYPVNDKNTLRVQVKGLKFWFAHYWPDETFPSDPDIAASRLKDHWGCSIIRSPYSGKL